MTVEVIQEAWELTVIKQQPNYLNFCRLFLHSTLEGGDG